MTAHELYLTGVMESFSTFCANTGVVYADRKTTSIQLLTLLQAVSTKTGYLNDPVKLLEETIKTTQLDFKATELLIKFFESQPPHQTTVLLRQFLLSLTAVGCSYSTIKNYRSDINQFFNFALSTDLNAILVKPKLQQFITQEHQNGSSFATIKRKLSSITQFSIWLEQVGYLEPYQSAAIESLNRNSKFIEESLATGTVPSSAMDRTQFRPMNSRLSPALSLGAAEFSSSLVSANNTQNISKSIKPLNLQSPKHQEYYHQLKSNLLDIQRKLNTKTSQLLLPYLNIAFLVLFFIGLSYFGYQQLYTQVNQSLAFPTSLTRPNRVLSFQGRLTDTAQNPITSATNFRFKLYDSGPSIVGGTQLWDSGSCSVTPDQDGIFNVGLGSDCGSEIGSSVFSENANIWLQVEVAAETLSPRQSIKTVAYALNSETLQGYPASASATENTVLVMNNSGEVVLGNTNPLLKSTGTSFTIEGRTLTLRTASGSNGNISLSPDGIGKVIATKYFEAPGATLSATYAGGTALVARGGPSGTADITQWQSNTGSVLSIVNSAGNIGIGTSTTRAALDVAGTASLSGELSFRGTTDPKINALNGENFGIRTSPGGDAGLSEKLTLLNNGNFGIGSTTPTALLDVNGAITMGNGTNGTSNGITVRGASWNGVIYPLNTNTLASSVRWAISGGSVAAPGLTNISDTATGIYFPSTSNMSLVTAGSERIRIDSAGNIGIGTTSASNFKVEVQGSVGPQANNTYNLGSNSLRWANIYATNFFQNGNTVCDTSGNCSTSGLWQNNSNAFSPRNEFATVADVLIGSTATASAKFGFINVNSGSPTATIAGNLAITAPTGANAATTYTAFNGGSINLRTSPGGDAGASSRIFIKNDGNIGIGSTSPAAKLDISGTLRTNSYTAFGSDTASAQYGLNSARGINVIHTAAPADGTGSVGIRSEITRTSSNTAGSPNAAYFGKTIINAPAATVVDNAVFWAENGTATAGTMTNQYGLYVDPLTTATNNYAVYTSGSTKSYFGGNVGLGTTSPTAQLEVLGTGTPQLKLSYNTSNNTTFTISSGGDLTVAPSGGDANITGTLDVSSTAAVGNNASINSNRAVYIDQIFTDLSASNYGAYVLNQAEPTGSGTGYQYGTFSYSRLDTAQNLTSGLRGVAGQATLNIIESSAANVEGLYGLASISNAVTATITAARGVNASFDAEDGTVTTGYGVYSSTGSVDLGSIGTGYGLYVAQGTTGPGTRTTQYGLRIAALTSATTDNFGIWGDSGDWVLDSDGDGVSGGTGAGGDLFIGESQDLEIYHDGTNSNINNLTGSLIINGGATTRPIILQSSTGNVGVGTTVAGAKLDVAGTVSSSGTLAFRGTTDPKIDVLNGENFGVRTSPGGDTGLTERLTITNDGNVGIGSTSPTANHRLDVNGNIFASGGGVYTSNNFVFGSSTSTGEYLTVSGNDINVLAGAGSRLYIDGDVGNVGVGTTDPNSFKLQVNGSVGPQTNNTHDLGSNSLRWANVYATAFFQAGNAVCDSSGNCGDLLWENTNGVHHPRGAYANIVDVVVGGTSTASADFRVTGLGNGSTDLAGYTYGRRFIDIDAQTYYTEPGSTSVAGAFAGNIGIGTTNPGAALQIQLPSAAVAGATQYIVRSNPTVAGAINSAQTALYGQQTFPTLNLTGGSSNTITDYYGELTDMTITAGTVTNYFGNYIAAPSGGTISNKYSIVTESGAGNAGIGTTNPGHLLELNGTAATAANGLGFGTSGTVDVELFRGAADRLDLGSGDSMNLVSGAYRVGNTDVITSGRLVQAANGTVGAPSLTFSSDSNTGFYTDGSDKLQVTTAGSNRMVIDSAGNVGIGTTDPASFKLQVNGSVGPQTNNTFDLGSNSLRWANVYATAFKQNGNNVCDDSGNCTTSGLWERNNNVYNPRNEWASVVDVVVGGTSTASADFRVTGLGNGSTDLAGYTYGRRFIDIDAQTYYTEPGSTSVAGAFAGNIGIGTTNPGAALQIQLPSAAVAGATQYIVRSNPTVAGAINSAQTALYGQQTFPTLNLTGGSSNTITDYYGELTDMTITAGTVTNYFGNYIAAPSGGTISNKYSIVTESGAGNAGIGTTNPGHLLELNGTAATAANGLGFGTSGTVDVELFRGAADRLDLGSGDSMNLVSGAYRVGNTDVITSGRLVQAANGTVGAPSLTFSSDSNTGFYTDGSDKLQVTTAGSNRMVIDSAGNVGIGTTDPASFKLQVNGSVGPQTNNTFDLGSNSLRWANVYATAFKQNGNDVCDSSGNCTSSGLWQNTLNAFHPRNEWASVADVLIGGSSTASAKFAFINVAAGTPTATISGNLALSVPTGSAPANTFDLLNNGTLNIRQSPGGNANLTSRLFIANNGNVGLGNVTSPTQALDINGDLRVRGNDITDSADATRITLGTTTTLTNTTTTLSGTSTLTASSLATFTTASSLSMASTTALTLGNNATVTLGASTGGTVNGSSASDGDLTIQGTSNATRTSSYVAIQPNGGNVGIGTSTAANSTLEVDGNMRVFGTQGYIKSMVSGGGGAVVQGIVDTDNSFARSIFGHNAYWDTTTNLWNAEAIGANDMQGILIPNNGGFQFITHASTANSARTMDHATFTAGAKMTILNGGSVGIGTTNPSELLHVAGDVRVTGAFYDSSNSAGSDNYILTSTGTGTQTAWVNPESILDSGWWDNTLNVIHPRGAYAAISDLVIGGSSTASADFQVIGSGASAGYVYGRRFIDIDATSYYIEPGNSSLSGLFAGNIGIGTTSTRAILDIAGDASTSGSLVFRGSSPATIDVLNNGRLDIQASPGGDAGLAAKLSIQSDGNVGLSTTTPTHLLELNGTGTTVASGIGFGASGTIDTELYRSAANRLAVASGDDFYLISGQYNQTTAIAASVAMTLTSTSTGLSSGGMLSISKTGASGSTAFTGDIAKVLYTQTFDGGTGVSHTGNVLDISRAYTLNSGGNTHTISGAVALFSDAATQAAGTLNSDADVVQISQAYTANTGSALNVTTASTNSPLTSYALRVNDDGTLTDTTPFVINADGNVGIGTTAPRSVVGVNGDLNISGSATISGTYAGNVALTLRSGPSATGDITRWTNNTGTILNVVNSAGNFGIGTSTAANFKVEVLGSVGPQANNTYNLGSNSLRWNNVYANAFFQNGNVVCDASGNCGNLWANTANVIHPINAYAEVTDLAIGGTSTATAEFRVTGIGNGTTNLAGYVYGKRFLDIDDTNYYVEPGNTTTAGLFSGNVAIGTTTTLAGAFGSAKLQVDKTSNGTLALHRESADTGGSTLEFLKRRTAWGVVTSGDRIGSIGFSAADSVDAANAAQIYAEVDGTPGSNDMPGRLVFATTLDGANAVTERMRIDNAGNVGVGTTSSFAKLDVSGAAAAGRSLLLRSGDANTFPADSHQILFGYNGANDYMHSIRSRHNSAADAGNALDFYVWDSGTDSVNNVPGTNFVMTMNGGNVGVGTDTPATKLAVDSNSNTQALRLYGTAETTEIADIFVSSDGHLQLDVTGGSDSSQYIDLRSEDDQWGLILRDSSGLTSNYANFYVTDSAADYLNIVVNAATSTTGLVVQSGGNVGVGTTAPATTLSVFGPSTSFQVSNTTSPSVGMYFSASNNDLYIGGDSSQDGNIFVKNLSGSARIELDSAGESFITGPLGNAYSTGSNSVVLSLGTTNANFPALGSTWSGSFATNLILSSSDIATISFHDSGESIGVFGHQDNDFFIDEGAGTWGLSDFGINVRNPKSTLVLYSNNESTTLTNFTQATTSAGINIMTDYTVSAYTPGVFWSTQNNNGDKPKAGIWLLEDGSGTDMYFGTSNNYTTGITNTALVIAEGSNVGIGSTGPTQKLDVNGVIRSGTSTNFAMMGNHPSYGTSYAAFWEDGSDYGILTSSTNTFINSPSGNLYFRNGNSDKMIIEGSSGNVAIGTTTTSANKLQVYGNTTVQFGNTTTANRGFYYTDGAADLYIGGTNTQDGSLKLVNTSGTVKVHIGAEDFGESTNELVNIGQDGTYGQVEIKLSTNNNIGLCHVTDGSLELIVDCSSAPTDLAEYFGTSDATIEPGDLVSATGEAYIVPDPHTEGVMTTKAFVKKTSGTYEHEMIGIISTSPNQVYGGDGVFADSENPRPVSMAGRVPTKVSTINGPIVVGDRLTASSIPGVAMKATQAGWVVGIALENYDEPGVGKIITFVKPTWYDPNIKLTQDGQLVINGSEGNYSVSPMAASPLENVASGALAVFAKIKSGIITTKELVVEQSATIADLSVNSMTVAGTSLQNYITTIVDSRLNQYNSVSLENSVDQATISGTLTATTINATSVSAQNTQLGSLLTNTATIAGTLTAQEGIFTDVISQSASISGSVTAENLTIENSARIAALESKTAELEDLKAQTAELTTATVSGTLFASDIYNFDNKVAQTLQQPGIIDLITGNIPEQPSTDPIVEQLTQAGYNPSNPQFIQDSGASIVIEQDDIILGSAAVFVEKYLEVNGIAYVSETLGVGQKIMVGNGMTIGSGSIAYAPTDNSPAVLRIQPSGQGSLELLAGLMTLENGKVTITGDLKVAGKTETDTLLTNLVQPKDFGSPFQVKVAGVTTEGGPVQKSRFEIINELGSPVATISAEGKASFAGGVDVAGQDLSPQTGTTPVQTTTQISGRGTVTANTTEVTIHSDKITADSLISVTPLGSTQNQVLYVKSQTPEDPQISGTEGSFVVGFDQAIGTDLNFTWLIIN